MRIERATLDGLWTVEADRVRDDRGWFVRVFDEDAFAARGLCTSYPQHSEARNLRRGTIRGLHFQDGDAGETKLIRCTRGSAYDVIVDVRAQSPTYGHWAAFELDADRPLALYVPAGFAHGYQTLVDETEFHYLISARYRPEAARGFAYNSAHLSIPWPLANPILSDRDRALPTFPEGR